MKAPRRAWGRDSATRERSQSSSAGAFAPDSSDALIPSSRPRHTPLDGGHRRGRREVGLAPIRYSSEHADGSSRLHVAHGWDQRLACRGRKSPGQRADLESRDPSADAQHPAGPGRPKLVAAEATISTRERVSWARANWADRTSGSERPLPRSCPPRLP